MNALAKKIAEFIVQDRAIAEGRIIRSASDFTDCDLEEIEVLRHNLFNLFYRSNGRKWEDVLADIKRISGSDFFLGFKAQEKIINTCARYGYEFTL